MIGERRPKRPTKKEKRLRTMDVILIVVVVLLISFTLKMINVFETQGAIPDTLCTCVFAALAGECGIMGWIKTTKDKYTDRKWLQEDRKQEKKDAAEQMKITNE